MDFVMEELSVGCCFCDENIKPNQTDPCNINILINIDKDEEEQCDQFFWCHLTCFRKILHPNIAPYLAAPLQG